MDVKNIVKELDRLYQSYIDEDVNISYRSNDQCEVVLNDLCNELGLNLTTDNGYKLKIIPWSDNELVLSRFSEDLIRLQRTNDTYNHIKFDGAYGLSKWIHSFDSSIQIPQLILAVGTFMDMFFTHNDVFNKHLLKLATNKKRTTEISYAKEIINSFKHHLTSLDKEEKLDIAMGSGIAITEEDCSGRWVRGFGQRDVFASKITFTQNPTGTYSVYVYDSDERLVSSSSRANYDNVVVVVKQLLEL